MPIWAAAAVIGAAGAVAFKTITSGVEDLGNAIDDTGSGALKIALAAGGTFIVMKQMKVI